MNPPDEMLSDYDGSELDALFHRAADELREETDRRWVEVAPAILKVALSASRRSLPVRAHAPSGPIHVSEQVIIAYVRDALDGALPGAAVASVSVQLADRDRFDGLFIELMVQYGLAILPIADHARALAATALARLGVESDRISISTSHVHVSDVTLGDPQTTDPSAE